MALPIEYDLSTSGRGATGFTSLNRGIMPTRAESPVISSDPEGGGRIVSPSRGITNRSGGLLGGTAVGETGGTPVGEGGPGPMPTLPIPPERSVSTRSPISRDSTSRAISRASSLSDRARLGVRDPGGRRLDYTGGIGSPAAGDQPGVDQPNLTPLDRNIQDLFRGFFNEPVRGSADKSGEFLYIPPAASSGGSSGIMILLLGGAAVAGYFIYKRFQGGI